MEEAFNRLTQNGENAAGNLICWFKDAKIADSSDEEITLEYFQLCCEDVSNVRLDELKLVLGKVAEERRKRYNEIVLILGLNALKTAFVSVLKQAKKLKDENWTSHGDSSLKSSKSAWSEGAAETRKSIPMF